MSPSTPAAIIVNVVSVQSWLTWWRHDERALLPEQSLIGVIIESSGETNHGGFYAPPFKK